MASKKKKTSKKSKQQKSYKVEYYENATTLKSRKFGAAAPAKGFAKSLVKMGKKVLGIFIFEAGATGSSGFISVSGK